MPASDRTTAQNPLGAYILRRLGELNISSHSELARRIGKSHTYVRHLIEGLNPQTGRPISPTLESIDALAHGLRVSEEALTAIARGVDPDKALAGVSVSPDAVLIPDLSRLPDAERERVKAVLQATGEAMVKAELAAWQPVAQIGADFRPPTKKVSKKAWCIPADLKEPVTKVEVELMKKLDPSTLGDLGPQQDERFWHYPRQERIQRLRYWVSEEEEFFSEDAEEGTG